MSYPSIAIVFFIGVLFFCAWKTSREKVVLLAALTFGLVVPLYEFYAQYELSRIGGEHARIDLFLILPSLLILACAAVRRISRKKGR